MLARRLLIVGSGGSFPPPPGEVMIGVRVRRTTDYTSQNDNDFVEFDQVVQDAHGFYDAGDPERLTIPVGFDGWWAEIRVTAIWAASVSSTYRELKIFKNGDTTEPWGVVQVSPNAANLSIQCTTDWLPDLVAGDYFTCALKSAGDETAYALENYSLYFSAVMVRPD